MKTLWDLLPFRAKPAPTPRRAPVRPAEAGATPMQRKYEDLSRTMLAEHRVRVRKWRSSMSGCAWEVRYANGRVSRLIEAPRPKGPMSAAVFLHEIGHHAIGLGAYRPRCLEEYHAWVWAIAEMERRGLNVTPRVRQRMAESLRYAVEKAARRGLRRLPEELVPYAPAELVQAP